MSTATSLCSRLLWTQASDGSSPLHEAAYVGSLSLIELMLHNGASPELRDNEGRMPMHYATYNKSERCLSALLQVRSILNYCCWHVDGLQILGSDMDALLMIMFGLLAQV